MFDRRLLQNFDWVLLLLLLLIATVSIINLYSATNQIWEDGGHQIFSKQIYWFLIGFVLFFMMTIFDYHIIERAAYPIYFFSVGLLILVLVIGKVYSGGQRWISVAGISFQPSEFAKIAMVIILSKFFAGQGEYTEYRLRDLWRPAILIAIPFALIVVDLGSPNKIRHRPGIGLAPDHLGVCRGQTLDSL